MKLYHSPGSCSMSCHIALEETGTPYTATVVDVGKGDNRDPAYRAISPRGFVPALDLGDRVLTEAAAILLHIAGRFPQAALLPEGGSIGEARAFEWLMFLTNTVHVAYAGLWRPERFTDDPAAREVLKREAPARIDALNHDIERRLGDEAFAVGESYSVVDAFLSVFFRWANRIGLDAAARRPRWPAWARRVEVRPAVASVLSKEGVSLWA